jgi:3-oxoadipate enol-lactonase
LSAELPELLNHVVHGERRDRSLLLIHPLGADRRFWDECISIWKPLVTCIVCDLRAAGLSPQAAAPVTIAEHVDDLEALRQELDVSTIIPTGCAIGAMVAASYAAKHGQYVEALVLSNPALRTTSKARENLIERATLVRRSGMAALLPGVVDRAFMQQPKEERYRRFLQRFAGQNAEAYALSALGILDADISGDLATIRCPTLVIAGGNDVLLPPDQARLVHAGIPRAEFALFEDAAHFVPYQQPERFAALVLDFLDRISGS